MVCTAPLVIEYAKRSGMPTSDAIDAMLRITPPPCRTIIGTAARAQKKMPFTFTAYSRSKSASDVRSIVPTCAMPALLTRMSTRPLSDATASKSRATASAFDTSQTNASARPPSRPIASAVRRAAASSTSTTATRACWRPKSAAIAAPMPDPAPVTTATLSVSRNTEDPRRVKYYTLPVKSTEFRHFLCYHAPHDEHRSPAAVTWRPPSFSSSR